MNHQNNFLSLIFSAMLTSTFLGAAPGSTTLASAGVDSQAVQRVISGLGSSGWHQSAGVITLPPAPPPAAAAATPCTQTDSINDGRIARLVTHARAQSLGRELDLSPAVAQVLHIQPQQLFLVGRRQPVVRGIGAIAGGEYILVTLTPLPTYHRVSATGVVSYACVVDVAAGQAREVTVTDTIRDAMRHEMAYWIQEADTLPATVASN